MPSRSEPGVAVLSQLPLPLSYRIAMGESEFFVSEANADAVAWLDRWPDWPQPQVLLVGPEGSGKSHLARLFAARVGARIVDPAEHADAEALFHAWNAATIDAPLLMIARRAPREWPHRLPDLASRLAATPLLAIADPDDALLGAVLAKQFADRGLRVPPEVAAYVLTRIERSFAAVSLTVAALDAAALAEGRAVTVPLARDVLEAQFALPLDG
ncbi:HdaA/DnaA family protein [Glacieibacterium sp.]|uniref:HdaA/DnaA family protein n=1 Tax=Glacieibacterium sp. TaxID=2860237 RepID=UPI003B008051